MQQGDITTLTVDEALEIYENSGLCIAFQMGTYANGGKEEFKSPEDMAAALSSGTNAIDSFKDYILSHARHREEAVRGLHIAACVMLWMSRVHTHILDGDGDRKDKYPEGPKSFIEHVTAYSILTDQDWGTACEEVLTSEEV